MRCPYGNEGRSTSASEPVHESGSSTPTPVTRVTWLLRCVISSAGLEKLRRSHAIGVVSAARWRITGGAINEL